MSNVANTEVKQSGRIVYDADPSHSSVGFTIRHLMISKVHGRFRDFEATLDLDPQNLENSRVSSKIKATSIDTDADDRDTHLRSGDFFDVENHPYLTFESTSVQVESQEKATIVGNLTIRGETREVTLDVERLGEATDPWGNRRVAYAATTTVNRKDFGLEWNQALETGGVLVGDKVKIQIEAQFVERSNGNE